MAMLAAPPTDRPNDQADGIDERAAAIKAVRELYKTLDVGKLRTEILDGRLVVSPSPMLLHGIIQYRLMFALGEVAEERGWWLIPHLTVDLAGTGDWVEPDLTVVPIGADPERWLHRADEVLMVAEITSPANPHDDREVKPRGCGLSGVPVYLLIDPVADPATVTVYGEPGPKGYIRHTTVPIGEKLELPEPIGHTLDTARLLPDVPGE
jgi:Uma2 family endonuclease